MKTPKWRTVLAVLALALVMLVALLICANAGELGAKIFPDVAHALVLFAFAITGGHAIQHLAGGAGVKGAVAALMTDVKPSEELPK